MDLRRDCKDLSVLHMRDISWPYLVQLEHRPQVTLGVIKSSLLLVDFDSHLLN